MATCIDCDREMLDLAVEACEVTMIVIHGKTFLKDSKYYDYNERCHDCNIVNGGNHVHHAGCDMERCPCCGGQLISCGCLDDDSDCGRKNA